MFVKKKRKSGQDADIARNHAFSLSFHLPFFLYWWGHGGSGAWEYRVHAAKGGQQNPCGRMRRYGLPPTLIFCLGIKNRHLLRAAR